jgi:carboxymethylenebutenolidase
METKITTRYFRKVRTARRDFLRKFIFLAGSIAAAMALIPKFARRNANAATLSAAHPVPEADRSPAHGTDRYDTALITGFITYPGATGDIGAYMARPKAERRYPAVIVIHENRGLQPHIMDVNRRMAAEGFLSLAPDGLSPSGGTPDDDDITEALRLNRELDYDKAVKNFTAAVKYLETHPLSNGNVGCTGFCWGGAMTNQVAVNAPSLKAAVPYYGSVPPSDQVPAIQAAIMAHYASDDPRINNGIEGFEEALKKSGKEYRIYIYENTQHAFNNDTNPERYNPEAARLAWERTIAFLREKLGP